MIWYNYRGRSCGRILGYINRYYSLSVAEWACVGDGVVTHNNERIATYEWIGETDSATFQFYGTGAKQAERNQLIWSRYHDEDYEEQISFIIQEMQRHIVYSLGGLYEIVRKYSYRWSDERCREELPFLTEIAKKLNLTN